MSLMVVAEGDTDIPVARKLALDAGIAVHAIINARGKANLDRNLTGYNQAARGSPWLVLRDVDSDQRCSGAIVADLVGPPEPWMALRLAVRAMESWLLADASAIAEFLDIEPGLVPANPDAEPDPKRCLVDLARRSRTTRIRRSLVPAAGVSVPVGRQYVTEIIDFTSNRGSVARAARRSESLRRARAALGSLARRWRSHVGDRG